MDHIQNLKTTIYLVTPIFLQNKKNKESLQKQEKSDENNKVQLNTIKTKHEVEITKSKSSGFLYIKRG